MQTIPGLFLGRWTSYDQQFYTHFVLFVFNQMLPFPTIHPSTFNNKRTEIDRQSGIEEKQCNTYTTSESETTSLLNIYHGNHRVWKTTGRLPLKLFRLQACNSHIFFRICKKTYFSNSNNLCCKHKIVVKMFTKVWFCRGCKAANAYRSKKEQKVQK